MARWEVKEPPVMIPVFVEHYDKILDEIADLLYHQACKYKSENTPFDHFDKTSQETPRLETQPKRRISS